MSFGQVRTIFELNPAIKGNLLYWHNLDVAITTSINCYVAITTSISVKQYSNNKEVGLSIAQTVILISIYQTRV